MSTMQGTDSVEGSIPGCEKAPIDVIDIIDLLS